MKKAVTLMLVACMLLSLTACFLPNTPEEALYKLRKADCRVEIHISDSNYVNSISEETGVNPEAVDAVVVASHNSLLEASALLVFCKDSWTAKQIAFYFSSELNALYQQGYYDDSRYYAFLKNYTVTSGGTVVFFGHSDILNAVRDIF